MDPEEVLRKGPKKRMNLTRKTKVLTKVIIISGLLIKLRTLEAPGVRRKIHKGSEYNNYKYKPNQ